MIVQIKTYNTTKFKQLIQISTEQSEQATVHRIITHRQNKAIWKHNINSLRHSKEYRIKNIKQYSIQVSIHNTSDSENQFT